jgi:Xaa-Pro dipeptidase
MAIAERPLELPTTDQPSRGERDRRWARVRELMRERGIDVIVAGPSTGTHYWDQADRRYLTQLPGDGGVVFPASGKVVGVFRQLRGEGGEGAERAWVEERASLEGGWGAKDGWGRTFARIISEIGHGKGTVAVCGLEKGLLNNVRLNEGFAQASLMRALRELLPEATFVDAGQVLGPARYIKSEEEIAFLRRATMVSEQAFYAMVQHARVGAFEPHVFGQMIAAELSVGGTVPTMFGWTSGPIWNMNPRIEMASHRRLQSGDGLFVEIEGRFGGYVAQIDATVHVGEVPSWTRDAHKVIVEDLFFAFDLLKAGITVREVRQRFRDRKRPAGYTGNFLMHGRGHGNDGPLVVGPFQTTSPDNDFAIEPMTSYIVKPFLAKDERWGIGHIGECVVIREDGVQRLGTWPLEHYWHNP